MTTELEIRLPRLHPGQKQIVNEAARFSIMACGRRYGKSVLLEDRTVHPALAGYPVAWFSPSYPMLTEVWRDMRRLLLPVTTRIDSQQHRIELVSGGVVDMWSLEAVDSARGRKYKRVVVDEAGLPANLAESWQNVIRPMLADYEGDAWLGGTPKGRNFFWQMWVRGRDGNEPEYKSWQRPTSDNPYIKASEIEAARKELPDAVFRQEYLAEFTESDGQVFRGIRECIGDYTDPTTDYPTRQFFPCQPHRGTFVMGVDWGRTNDFTVAVVMDAHSKRVVDVDRFNQVGWDLQRTRITSMYRRWHVSGGYVETNSIGGPNLEALQREGLALSGFETTHATKSALIEGLVLAIENKAISYPDIPELSELEAYEQQRMPSGIIKYGAPEGMHDDFVISLALATKACINAPTDYGDMRLFE